MKVLFCSSEVFPFAKTGGLADVSGSLPLSLEKLGLEIKISMPWYKGIKPQKNFEDFGISKIGKSIEVIFIKNDEYFNRDGLYGTETGDYPDNLERFKFYCEKTLEIIKKINFKPHIIHCNDWQTGLIPVFLKFKLNSDEFYKDIKTAFTIHNLAYQGLFEKEKFPLLGLDQSLFSIDGLEFYGKINILKGALLFSDVLITVSPTYSKEIQTPEFGCGLEGVLRKRKDNLFGILNGLDYKIWDPKKDKLIFNTYDNKNLRAKTLNKIKLQSELGLKKDKDLILLGFVGRLTEQKGIDLICKALPQILNKKKFEVIILGKGDESYHKKLEELSKTLDKKYFSLNIKFDETLAHKIYAGCDFFLMPSRFEPCGLGQLISFKYGTIPIVHSTGGLKDTVTDVFSEKKGRGIVFYKMELDCFMEALEKSEILFKNKGLLKEVRNRIMKLSFSWLDSAKSYLEIYNKCLS